MAPTERICKTCGRPLKPSAFQTVRGTNGKTYYLRECKQCRRFRYYSSDLIYNRVYQRERRRKDPDGVRQYDREYYARHAEQERAIVKRSRINRAKKGTK